MGKTGTETDVKHKSSLDLAHPCAMEKAFAKKHSGFLT